MIVNNRKEKEREMVFYTLYKHQANKWTDEKEDALQVDDDSAFLFYNRQ